jgi:hypothetical protein
MKLSGESLLARMLGGGTIQPSMIQRLVPTEAKTDGSLPMRREDSRPALGFPLTM